MKKFHIAVVEDDLAFAAELEEFLGASGYTVSSYDSSQKFLAALRQSECDLLIVDWSIPDLSGIEVLEYIRKFHPDMPAIMLTARAENIDIVRGLQAGADDYVQGPLSSEIVFERVTTNDNPGEASPPLRSRLVNGDLSLDLAAHQLRWRGEPVPLRPNEFRLLIHFMEHPDQVFSRTALIEHLGKDGEAIDERTVDVWVGRLRRALTAAGAPDPLRTVRSLGYVMDSVEG